VTGTEFSSVARARLASEGLDVRAPEGWAAGFADGELDAAVMLEVIEHVADVQGLMADLARVIRPGGRLVLSTPNIDSLTRRVIGPRWRIITEEHLWYFSPATLARLLARYRFSLRRIESRNIYPPDIWLALARNGAVRGDRACGDQPNSRLRALTARPGPGRWLKHGVNACLRASGLGDTIWVTAERAAADRPETAAG
jgi:SAM-dependent methyltransferase